jgi:hypothetical protein
MSTTVQIGVAIRPEDDPIADDITLNYPPGVLTQFPTYRPDSPGGMAGEIWNPYFGLGELGSKVSYFIGLFNHSDTTEILGVNQLELIFYYPDSPLRNCFLDGLDFMNFLAGASSVAGLDLMQLAQESFIDLDLFHQVRDQIMASSPQGRYYRGLYNAFSPEFLQITAQNVGLLGEINQAIQAWTPAFRALVDGQGDQAAITPAMIERADELLAAYESKAGPELAAIIRQEMDALDLQSFAGLTMDEALAKVNERPVSELFLPNISK